jgi:hypothetical protein
VKREDRCGIKRIYDPRMEIVEMQLAAPAPVATAAAASQPVECTAETAECTCPDFCERDHEND